ncbi:Carbon-nitrogen hydrolase [Apiotrichum porosum]|uniref:Carbon-nitrogen hydrolase n=1 Tax=Apiotrichum porosum TaxID=105984 RepID=A0A427Y0I3_9TREE|nr:Carbon-nitrogen hydrolase [Apiotrichum porosum]RSH84550.1 Carbon-nitrogen hydrolase [Apiotrichum porosum]
MTALPPVPVYRAQPIRIACVQFDPKLGKGVENAAKVESMTARLQPGMLDLLVLPEMALSGYMFTTPSAIQPHLEHPTTGLTATLAKKLAARLRCHVVAGYPEAFSDDEPVVPPRASASTSTADDTPIVTAPPADPPVFAEINGTGTGTGTDPSLPPAPPANGSHANGTHLLPPPPSFPPKRPNGPSHPLTAAQVGYNSALIASPAGEVVGNYRKTFLFETDKNWAREGSGFMHWDLPAPLGRVAIGICMDLNPEDFISPWNAYELATYCATNAVDMLVVPMNWLDPREQDSDSDSDSDSDTDTHSDTGSDGERVPPRDPNAPSINNLNYWAARLAPLHDPAPTYAAAAPPGYDGAGAGAGAGAPSASAPPKEVVFVSCNRAGTEGGTLFAGSSCVMTMRSEPKAVELVEVCTRSEERVMLAIVT